MNKSNIVEIKQGHLKKEDILELIDIAKKTVQGLLAEWHGLKLQQIRLDNANRQRVEEQKFYHQQEIYDMRNRK